MAAEPRDHVLQVTWDGDTGYELYGVLPYAYWLHTHCHRVETRTPSAQALYFFSDRHEQRPKAAAPGAMQRCCPMPPLPHHVLPEDHFHPPPLKAMYANADLRWRKPLFVITNKYVVEMFGRAQNYINVASLREILKVVVKKYQVYLGVQPPLSLEIVCCTR